MTVLYNNKIIAAKLALGTKTVDKFYNLVDENFIQDVSDDLTLFISQERVDSVLVFPPVNSYRRFLIHQTVEGLAGGLTTFSIGEGDQRRTVVCRNRHLLSDEACANWNMRTPSERHDANISNTNTTVGGCKNGGQEKSRSGSTKPRRPDRAVYVPRALRATETPDEARRGHSADTRPPKSPGGRDKSACSSRKSIDKKFCNVYTPPHLRGASKCEAAPSEPQADRRPPTPSRKSGPADTALSDKPDRSPMDVDGENFYIGDYFTNGQLGFYAPNYNKYVDTPADWSESDSMAATHDRNSEFLDKHYLYKDEDVEKNELKRASQEINRSSKRIIKQSFDSDVLVISDPVDDNESINKSEMNSTTQHTVFTDRHEKENNNKDNIQPKRKLEAKVSLKREENDWDAVFDDSGECLDPSLLEELTSTVGKVHISKPSKSYEEYQTTSQTLLAAPGDLAHVVEVYDFPSEFKTNDLLSLFSEYKDTGFDIKWVDDTHALIVFSSAKIAADVLSQQRSLARCRPLHAATAKSQNKAKRCTGCLQPYRQRPETCTALARRLVSGALGVKLSTAQQERAEERRLITIAREKKRQAALHKEAAWDGSLANQSET